MNTHTYTHDQQTNLQSSFHILTTNNIRNLCVCAHTIQSPILILMHSCDLLLNSSEEALRVEEASHPVGGGATMSQPTAILDIAEE